MLSFQTFLNEDKSGKNVHLDHAEDAPILYGVVGTRATINFLRSLRDMLVGHSAAAVDVTVKFDGAPAVICGIDPATKKFFVGTKGVFANNPKLNFTDDDIDKNHPGEGLNQKLKLALQYLPELGITGVLQGDMMFTHEDLQHKTIAGQKMVVFQPNTIAYAVPANSALAASIEAAKLGIVFHTSYTGGPTISDMKASFGANIARLRRTKNVWFRDAAYEDASGTASFTNAEYDHISDIIGDIGALFNQIPGAVMNKIATNETLKIQISTYNNSKVREGQKITDTAAHVHGLIQWVESKLNAEIAAVKMQKTKLQREAIKTQVMNFYKEHRHDLKLIFDLQNLIVDAKTMIIRKLEQAESIGAFFKTDDGYRVTKPEGFVAIDRLSGNAIKLVDRLQFSHQNFVAAKNWTK